MDGSRPLVENIEGMSMMEIAIQEILQDKITADFGEGSAADMASGAE